MGTMEKAGIAVVGVLILIIIVVGLVNKNTEPEETKNKTTVASNESKSKSTDSNSRSKKGTKSSREGLNRNLDVKGGRGVAETFRGNERGGTPGKFIKTGKGTSKADRSGAGIKIDTDAPRNSKFGRDSGGARNQNQNRIAAGRGKKPNAGKTPEPRASSVREHVVQNGEDMTRIAKKYYGKSSLYWLIQRANPQVNPRSMKEGDKLVIPDLEVARATRAGKANVSKTEAKNSGDGPARLVSAPRPSFIPDSYIKNYSSKSTKSAKPAAVSSKVTYKKGDKAYTVRPNDSLGTVAKKTMGSARHAGAIFKANRKLMKSPDKLQIGWVLTIPAID
ncbi:MAG: LysM peptidoglycan-binding domain-containing protein [Planctomycetota bacterium]